MPQQDIRQTLVQESAIKMSTIAPTGNIPGILQGLLEKYINVNPTVIPNYLELQKAVVEAGQTAASLEQVAGDPLKTEMATMQTDLRLREIKHLLSISLPVNIDRFGLETSYIEMLQNVDKAGLKRYGAPSKLGLKDIENILAGMEGLQASAAYGQEIAQQVEHLIYPLMVSCQDPMLINQWMCFIANIEYMMIATQILSDLARRANELKPNAKAFRKDSNNRSGYQKPGWLENVDNNVNNTSREKMVMLNAIKQFIDQNILSTNVFTMYNPELLYDNLIDLSDDALKYVFTFTTNASNITASDSDIMKKLAIGTHVLTYYDQSTGNVLNVIPPQIRMALGVIICAKSNSPDHALLTLCNILGIAPIAYQAYNPGVTYMLHLSFVYNNPNIFFGHLLVENRSSDLFELSKRLLGFDGIRLPLLTANDITFLKQQAAGDVGNMYKTSQGIAQFIAKKGITASPAAFNEMAEIICSLVVAS